MADAVFFGRRITAERLGVSVPTVDRLIAAGKLRAGKIGRRVVVSDQAIEEFRQEVERRGLAS
jgi:excisionase family DNA binding protein